MATEEESELDTSSKSPQKSVEDVSKAAVEPKTRHNLPKKRNGSIIERSAALYSRRHLTSGAKGIHGPGDSYRNERFIIHEFAHTAALVSTIISI